MEYAQTVLRQLMAFAIYAGAGVIGARTHIVDESALKGFANFLMKICIPVMLFLNTTNGITAKQVLDSFGIVLAALVLYALLIALSAVLARAFHLHGEDKPLYQVCVIFGNTGFIGIPVVMGLFPERGALYLALFSLVDQGLLWSLGMRLTTPAALRSSGSTALKKMINPATVSIVLSLIAVFAGFRLPAQLSQILSAFSSATTPLAMFYLGALFCGFNFAGCWKQKRYYVLILTKMLLLPPLVFLAARAAGMQREVCTTLAVLCGMPCMTSTAMMAKSNHASEETVMGGIFLTTVACAVTLPLVCCVLALLH